ncbi:hypothetical protein Rhopal_006072-T1 [Rhodotorula paludigena]|uniref:Six-hairpin glycosidase-like protein n=1 Tax=Rhodotorula paludigena TaxID=86838 RepID=A0AAV5GUJ5_9BASI|nr:hypothetical protein Rhopal_006072-T1 [Rhodotorula paludigena]
MLVALACVVAVLAQPLLASPTSLRLSKRDDQPGLQSSSALVERQVQGIEALLNRTALLSWETGAHLEALVEFHSPSLSPFSSESDWSELTPRDAAFLPPGLLSRVGQIMGNASESGGPQLMQDGSAADPASVGPFVVLANFTLDNDGSELVQGVGRGEIEAAVQRQVDVLLQGTPKTADGAISHRTEDVELWSDFVYMVPPFFAYLGALTQNRTLLQAAYDQCRLYREHLRVSSGDEAGLWRHIDNRFEGGGDMRDDGLWATGNGWAAQGMLRVLASFANQDDDDLQNAFESQARDLGDWVKEIVERTWEMPRRSGLLYNYLNDTSSFADASGSAILASATYRLAYVAREFDGLSSSAPSSSSLSAAERMYRTLITSDGRHLSNPQGVLRPVVDPMSFDLQLDNVRADGSGSVSPEGEAFVLLLESARRDYLANGGDVPDVSADSGADRAGAASSLVGVLAAVAVLLFA